MAKNKELANLTPEQRAIYEENLVQDWGMKSAIETAVEEALEKALKEKQMEIAKNLIMLDLDNAMIAKGTGLTLEQIQQLRDDKQK